MHCSQAIHCLPPPYLCRVHNHPRYCVKSPIVVHGRQAIHPRCCIGFILALAGVQVQYGHKLEQLPSSLKKRNVEKDKRGRGEKMIKSFVKHQSEAD